MEFPKIRNAILGAQIIRAIIFGVPYFGKLPHGASQSFFERQDNRR